LSPSRRPSPDHWPRDRPVRWGALGRNLSTFAVTTIAFVVQFALVVPVVMLSSTAWSGWLQILVALVWGVGTVLAAWCWITWRPVVLLAPVVTGLVIWLAAGAS